MDIALVVPDFLSGTNALSVRGQAIARELARCGHRITILCGADKGSFDVDGVIIKKGRFKLPSNTMPLWMRAVGEAMLGINIAWKLLFVKKDRVVVTTPPFIIMLIVAFVSRIFRIPYILDVRDLYPEVYANAGVVSRNSSFFKLIDWFVCGVYRSAFKIVAVTKEVATYLEDKLKGREVFVAMNGYVSDRFYPENSFIPVDRPVTVICHGNFGELFDEISFIEIASNLRRMVKIPYEIVLIGFGKKLEGLREKSLPNVHILGRMSQGDVAKHVRNADIGISLHLPYDESCRGFAVKVFEYIGSGIPSVVTPKNEGGRFVVERGFGFSFAQGECGNVAGCIQMLIEDAELRLKISKHIQNDRGEFSLENQVVVFSRVLFE
ncbi:glycosyltransferase family 4 protein [Frateuria sp. Soil773]|uniref:glycosyltransferase family 4 protein n=1 Tax=Frateuria sp. Soil773 TaxID=1736407 RepID=UPI0009EB6737|nr:glycosyltransferase family 4 protein [Frateuria sp. Soil773]